MNEQKTLHVERTSKRKALPRMSAENSLAVEEGVVAQAGEVNGAVLLTGDEIGRRARGIVPGRAELRLLQEFDQRRVG